MRAGLPELSTPYPLGTLLPPVLQDDPTSIRLTAALDDVLAPVIATLDCLAAYIEPGLAPTDHLEWLAVWVGATLDENWLVERQRATVAKAVDLHRSRGTLSGLRAHVEAATGARVEVVDSGGVATSTSPDGPLPGDPQPHVLVRIHPPAQGRGVDRTAVEELVAEAKPAHVTHAVEVAGAHDLG